MCLVSNFVLSKVCQKSSVHCTTNPLKPVVECWSWGSTLVQKVLKQLYGGYMNNTGSIAKGTIGSTEQMQLHILYSWKKTQKTWPLNIITIAPKSTKMKPGKTKM